ncbi:MAG: alpha/beta hydrolase [Clostridia bacterium]|nr:alpha/beta hydrolase [Clostridia bacterium]
MSIPIETVQTGEIQMRFFRFGTGKTPLVIIPGLSVKPVSESAAAIAKQYRQFAEDFTVYVFDRRANLPAQYTVAQMAEDTAAAISALGLCRYCLFGASQGGMMAMLIAAAHPEAVEKLALGSSCVRVNETAYRVISHWAELARRHKSEALYLDFCQKVYPPSFFEKYKDLFVAMSETVSDAELDNFVTLCEGTAGFDARAALAALRCPVLALSAADDAVLGAQAAAELAAAGQQNPQFEQYLYTGYGHDAYDTAPDYQQRLFDFFIT